MDLTKIRRIRPTHKQSKALQYLKEGNSIRRSMIKAGYSLKTADKGKLFFAQEGVQSALSGLKEYMINAGLTNEKIAKKMAELMDFKKVVSVTKDGDKILHPDGEIQLKSVKEWREIMGHAESEGPKVKRRLTVEEFLDDEVKE